MQCPVVKVKFDNEQGFYLLNESDFDESKHELFIESSESFQTESAGKTDEPAPVAKTDEPAPVAKTDEPAPVAKTDEPAPVAKTQDAGAAGPKPPWASRRTKP